MRQFTDRMEQGQDFSGGARGSHVMKSEWPLGERRAVHAMKDDAISIERRALHAKKVEVAPVATVGVVTGAHGGTKQGDRSVNHRAGHAATRPRRWLVPVVGAAGALAVGLSTGAAYAYFRSTGAGSARGTAGMLQAISLSAVSGTPGAPLLPGQSGDVLLNVNNSNPHALTLVSTAANGPMTVSGGSGCTLSDSGVTFNAQSGLSINVPAGSSRLVDLPGAVSMARSSNTGCQGATFSFPITITVQTQ